MAQLYFILKKWFSQSNIYCIWMIIVSVAAIFHMHIAVRMIIAYV